MVDPRFDWNFEMPPNRKPGVGWEVNCGHLKPGKCTDVRSLLGATQRAE